MVAPRSALIIGNAAYKPARLQNAIADAEAIRERLVELDFDVKVHNDLAYMSFLKERTNFISSLRTYREDNDSSVDVVVLYYAGHGISHNGNNYFIPTDYVPENHDDLANFEKLHLESFVSEIEQHAKAVISFFDACRTPINAPHYARITDRLDALPLQPRSNKPKDPRTPMGRFTIYSTSKGESANDGAHGTNSPFAEAITENIERPNQDLIKLCNRVRQYVQCNTHYNQNIEFHDNLSSEFYFLKKEPRKPVAVNDDKGEHSEHNSKLIVLSRKTATRSLASSMSSFAQLIVVTAAVVYVYLGGLSTSGGRAYSPSMPIAEDDNGTACRKLLRRAQILLPLFDSQETAEHEGEDTTAALPDVTLPSPFQLYFSGGAVHWWEALPQVRSSSEVSISAEAQEQRVSPGNEPEDVPLRVNNWGPRME